MTIHILFIGDIVGSAGRQAVKEALPAVRSKYNPDIIIANAENAAGGRGLTEQIARELFEWGVHGLTLGNHAWDNKSIFDFIDREERIVRPANYPPGTPGRGWTTIKSGSRELTVVNLQGRTFLPPLDCPFRHMDTLLAGLPRKNKCILVDFHAEATSEKIALGWHLDGKVSALVGTHTHVQTNDNRILPGGTGYLSDAGMTGPRDGVLGMERDAVLKKFLTQLPVRFEVASGSWIFHAVLIRVDEATGRASQMKLIRLEQEDLQFL